MLARVAENLYWMGRYLERAENQARLLDVQRLLGSEFVDAVDPWEFVLDTLGASKDFSAAREAEPDLTPEDYLVHAAAHHHSIRSTVASARALAMELREHTSREVFEAINRLYLALQTSATQRIGHTLEQTRSAVATVYGLFENTVLQTEGTHWFRMGILVERADMTSRIVDAKYFMTLPEGETAGGAVARHQWRGVLRSASALEAYHKTFQGSIRDDRVIDLLFLSPVFPRSLVYCIDAMREEFADATVATPPQRSLAASTELAVVQLEVKAQTGAGIVLAGLHEFIDRIQATLIRIDRSLGSDLFGIPAPLALTAGVGNGLGHAESLQSN